jgi:hypothetical protein
MKRRLGVGVRWPPAWGVGEVVKIEPESWKLKNLHCYKPLPGNGWLRHCRLEKVQLALL